MDKFNKIQGDSRGLRRWRRVVLAGPTYIVRETPLGTANPESRVRVTITEEYTHMYDALVIDL